MLIFVYMYIWDDIDMRWVFIIMMKVYYYGSINTYLMYDIIWYSMIYVVLYCTVLHYIIIYIRLHYITLHYNILDYIIWIN